jgi:anti-sigma B factor antagonist
MTGMEIEQVDGVPVAKLSEDLDAANAATVHRELAEALGPNALTLVVDLSSTRYVDSAGIDMLLRFSDRLNRRRAKLVLVVPENSQLRRLFAIVGLPEAIAVHATVEDARAAD